jgi:hypothetical protein
MEENESEDEERTIHEGKDYNYYCRICACGFTHTPGLDRHLFNIHGCVVTPQRLRGRGSRQSVSHARVGRSPDLERIMNQLDVEKEKQKNRRGDRAVARGRNPRSPRRHSGDSDQSSQQNEKRRDELRQKFNTNRIQASRILRRIYPNQPHLYRLNTGTATGDDQSVDQEDVSPSEDSHHGIANDYQHDRGPRLDDMDCKPALPNKDRSKSNKMAPSSTVTLKEQNENRKVDTNQDQSISYNNMSRGRSEEQHLNTNQKVDARLIWNESIN